jgi:hypothetical protein
MSCASNTDAAALPSDGKLPPPAARQTTSHAPATTVVKAIDSDRDPAIKSKSMSTSQSPTLDILENTRPSIVEVGAFLFLPRFPSVSLYLVTHVSLDSRNSKTITLPTLSLRNAANPRLYECDF